MKPTISINVMLVAFCALLLGFVFISARYADQASAKSSIAIYQGK